MTLNSQGMPKATCCPPLFNFGFVFFFLVVKHARPQLVPDASSNRKNGLQLSHMCPHALHNVLTDSGGPYKALKGLIRPLGAL